MDVPINYSILDKRNIKDFTFLTFSEYKKKDVINEFEKSINDQKLEDSCNWMIELHISGSLDSIWKSIFNLISKNINIENPYLPSWILLKFIKYNKLINNFKKGFEYESRNNQEMRNLFADIITILVYSNKNKRLDNLPKIKDNDFTKDNISYKLISKNSNIIDNIISSNDDKDIVLAINEIANILKIDILKCEDLIYWYIWLLKFEKIKKKNNILFTCKKRNIEGVNSKFFNDWNWLIWKIIFQECKLKFNDKLTNEINALFRIYKWKFSNSTKISKQYIIFHAFLLLKSDINWKIPLIHKYELRVQACCNINHLYKFKNINKSDSIKSNYLLDNYSNNNITNYFTKNSSTTNNQRKYSNLDLNFDNYSDKYSDNNYFNDNNYYNKDYNDINDNNENNDDNNEEYDNKKIYDEINEKVKAKQTINIKTKNKTKEFKIKNKNDEAEKKESLIFDKMKHLNSMIFYKGFNSQEYKNNKYNENNNENNNEYNNENKLIKI